MSQSSNTGEEEYLVLKRMSEEGAVVRQQSEPRSPDLLLSPRDDAPLAIPPTTTLLLYTSGCLSLQSDRQTYKINGVGQAVYRYQRARREGTASSAQVS